jgi:hypothetical protein
MYFRAMATLQTGGLFSVDPFSTDRFGCRL